MRYTPTTELATELAEDLLGNPGNPEKTQAYFFLLLVADSTRMDTEADVSFGTVLDGGYFYVEQDEDGYYIAEHHEGFAAEVFAIMRSRHGDYEQYLVAVLSNTNFSTLDAGAKGRIVEDCFFIILRSQSPILFPFLKIPAQTQTNPSSFSVQATGSNVVDVPGGDEEVLEEVVWPSDVEIFVFIPLNRRYKGIDFIVARKTQNTLYIYFVQCTVQQPHNHSICESELYGLWEELLKMSAGTKKCYSNLVFLTPHSTNLRPPGPQSIATFFARKTKLHVQFAKIQGSHRLLDAVRNRFP